MINCGCKEESIKSLSFNLRNMCVLKLSETQLKSKVPCDPEKHKLDKKSELMTKSFFIGA